METAFNNQLHSVCTPAGPTTPDSLLVFLLEEEPFLLYHHTLPPLPPGAPLPCQACQGSGPLSKVQPLLFHYLVPFSSISSFFFIGHNINTITHKEKRKAKVLVTQLRPALCDPMESTGLLCPWNSAGKNTGVSSHSLHQGIFLTQGSNASLLNCRHILYHLSHQGSPSQRTSHK